MDYRSPSDMAAAVGSTSSLSNPAINHPVALSEDQVSDKEQRDPIDSPSHDNYRLHPTCRIRGPGQSTPSDTATGIVESMRSCSGLLFQHCYLRANFSCRRRIQMTIQMKSDIFDIKIIRAASSAVISLLNIVPKRIPKRVPKRVGVENSSTEVATMRGGTSTESSSGHRK
ncbi:unnamed protein product [Aspergillus oryzae]|nr:unnamed protein product [Aspergillus oryzae]